MLTSQISENVLMQINWYFLVLKYIKFYIVAGSQEKEGSVVWRQTRPKNSMFTSTGAPGTALPIF